LDWLFGTRPILMAVFVLLGGAAGVLNVWRMFAPKRGPAPGKGVRAKEARANDVRPEDVLDKDRGL
jgi:ATP synthase protein I